MESISPSFHGSWSFATTKLHNSLIPGFHGLAYPSAMDTKTESGRRIAAARKLAEMTLQEVCNAIPGLTVTRLSNWEHGTRMISVDEAKRLAPVLKTTASYLLTIDDEPGDPRERALLEKYRLCDENSQRMLHRVAEAECAYRVSALESTLRSHQ